MTIADVIDRCPGELLSATANATATSGYVICRGASGSGVYVNLLDGGVNRAAYFTSQDLAKIVDAWHGADHRVVNGAPTFMARERKWRPGDAQD